MGTEVKHIAAHAGHALRDGEGGETSAHGKGIVANGGDTLGNGDGGEAGTIIVFAMY